MNFKRYAGATLALFVFIFLYEWLVHGILLVDWYHETKQLWRTESEMMANMPLGMVSTFILSAWATFAFTQIYPDGGIRNGLLFGLFLGVFAGILMGEWYFYLPVAGKLGWSWFASWLGEWIGGGLLVGSIYRK